MARAVPPQASNAVLPTDVPHREAYVLVFDRLDVEADGGQGLHQLSQLHLVEDGCLARRVQAHHHDALLRVKREQLDKPVSHLQPLFVFFASTCSVSSSSCSTLSPWRALQVLLMLQEACSSPFRCFYFFSATWLFCRPDQSGPLIIF